MLDHVSLGVRNIDAARRFYSASLKPLGYRLLHDGSTSLGYGDGHAGLWVLAAEHPVPADEKSGLHLCFSAPNRAAVDAFHQAALTAGGKDNGAPGLRADYGTGYYAAFIVDPDGYRLEAYCGK
ncbi:MAG TPA: VOC family protein [Stellaceae bacterium]|nr:VOC family protein [Stellaceae bacterium]